MAGPEWNTTVNYEIFPMVYETLLGVDPTTLDWMPSLATHWQISPDKLTYRFRIDPNARFSDGTPVTSGRCRCNLVDFMRDKTLQDPYFYTQFIKLEKPVAESKYIVRIKAKELGWRNFVYCAADVVFPAHVLKTIDGDRISKDYNFKLLPGSGPYTIQRIRHQKGQIHYQYDAAKTIGPRNYRANAGMNNFDALSSLPLFATKTWLLRCSRRASSTILEIRPRAKTMGGGNELRQLSTRACSSRREVFNNYPAGT